MRQEYKTAPSSDKETGSARVFAQLRKDILQVILAPGSPLDEIRLSERFKLSRSPIREALVRLSSEGLVSILPNRSTVVAPLNFETLPEFLEALDLYQRATTKSAALLRTEQDLEDIIEAQGRYEEQTRLSFESGSSIPMIESNYEFHMRIARAGKNRYLENFYSRVLNEGRRMLHFHFEFHRLDPEMNANKLGADHHEMIAAIRTRDTEAAERIAHDHAMQFKGRFIQFLTNNVRDALRSA